MTSGNEPGVIKLVVERAGKGMKTLLQYRTDSPVNAGKSPEGVLANLTVDKQLKTPKVLPLLRRGDVLRLFLKPDASDGIDASDCVIQIPYSENGNYHELNAADFSFTTDLNSLVAGGWVELGTGYTIPNDVDIAQVGGGAIVLSIEDDA